MSINELLEIAGAALAQIKAAVNDKAGEQGIDGYKPLEDGVNEFKRIPDAIDMLSSPLAKRFGEIGYPGIPKILIDGIALSERLVEEWSSLGSWSPTSPTITTEAEKALITSDEYINMPYLPQVYVEGDLDTKELFKGCSKAFCAKDVKVVKSGESLFEGCANLRSIKSVEVVEEKEEGKKNVASLKNMFKGCTILQSIPNTTGWYVNEVTSLSGTFNGCKNLQSLEIGGWNVSNVEDFSSCFRGCVLKNDLNLSSWAVENASNVASMFELCTCSSLTIGIWNLSQVTDASKMFRYCSPTNEEVKYIDLTEVIWNENVNLSEFINYSSLKSLVGNRTLKAVGERTSADCIKLFEGVKSDIDLRTNNATIDKATLQAVYNGIANVKDTGIKPQIIVKENHCTFPSTLDDYRSKLTGIGWTLNIVV